MSTVNSEQGEFWQDLAPTWLEAEQHTELIADPFGSAAMDRLMLEPGWRVLDVGCGSGGTTLELAERVAPGGAAVGLDIAPAMIDAARAGAAAGGVAGVEFVVGDPQAGDVGELGADGYDAVFSQFGVMFFSDPSVAFGNLRRALRPGGRLAFTCWQDLFSNEWMFVPGAAVMGVTGALPPMPGPGEPGPFSLADADATAALLTAAGFGDVTITPVDDVMEVPESKIESIVRMASGVGPLREALRVTQNDADRDELVSAVRTALVERIVDGEIRLSAAALIVSAHA